MSEQSEAAPLVEYEAPILPKPTLGPIDHKLQLSLEQDALSTALVALKLIDTLAGYDGYDDEITRLKAHTKGLLVRYLYEP